MTSVRTQKDEDSEDEVNGECAVCKAPTEDENLVGCWECDCWIHIKCANITDLEFKILRHGSKEIEYACKNCKKLKKESRRAKDELRNENMKLKDMNAELKISYEKIVSEQDTDANKGKQQRNIIGQECQKQVKSEITKVVDSMKRNLIKIFTDMKHECLENTVKRD